MTIAVEGGLPTEAIDRVPYGPAVAIFRREVREAARSHRFRLVGGVIVLLLALAAVSYAARLRAEVEAVAELRAAYGAEVHGRTLAEAAAVRHPAIKPPWKLAFLADGGQGRTPDVYSQALSAWVAPEIVRSRRFPQESVGPHGTAAIDWLFVAGVVLPLAAFVLFHDAVCTERQAGTLKILLSYPVARWQVFVGKLAAAAACLALPTLIGAGLALAVFLGSSGVSFTAAEATKLALVVLLMLWAILYSCLVALLVSSLTRDAAASLVVLSLLWVTAVVVVPATAGLVAQELAPLPSSAEIGHRRAEVRRQITAGPSSSGQRWRSREAASADDFAWERLSAEAENRRYALEDSIRREVLKHKLAQAELAQQLAAISPTALIQSHGARLVGSGTARERAFLDQVWDFREQLAETLRRLDLEDPESPHILFFPEYLSRRPLAPADLPGFAFQERSISQGLRAAGLALAVLALETVLLAAAALAAFERHGAG